MFTVLDAYMGNYDGWRGTLAEVAAAEAKIPREDKKEIVYWRGSESGINQTTLGEKVPCEKLG